MTPAAIQRLPFVSVLLLATLFSSSYAQEAEVTGGAHDAASPPNVVLIYTDDQEKSDLSCYGGDVPTPNIDRLAEEGLKFTRFYPSSPVCTPSRYNLLTGRFASRSQWLQAYYPTVAPPVIRWNTNFVPGEPTIATLLKGAGYVTGIVGKWHNGRPLLDAVAEDADPHARAVAKRLRSNYNRICDRVRRAAGFDFAESIYADNVLWLPLPKSLKYHNQEWITAGAIDFIEKNADRPFFLYVATTLPHRPGALPALHTDARMTPAGILDHAPKVQPSRSDVLRRADEAGLSKKDRRRERWAGLVWLDDGIGAILDKLDDLQLADRTIVIFASDHARRGKMTCYAGPVPCLVRWPGVVRPGGVCEELVSNVDIVPTVLNACGVTVPAEVTIDGCSWLPVFKDPRSAVRDSLFLEITSTRGVVTKDWKYVAIRYSPGIRALIAATDRHEFNQEGSYYAEGTDRHVRYNADQLFPGYYDDDQLYDLRSDPDQQVNLAGQAKYAAVLKTMQGHLRAYSQRLPHAFGEFAAGSMPCEDAELPKKDTEK